MIKEPISNYLAVLQELLTATIPDINSKSIKIFVSGKGRNPYNAKATMIGSHIKVDL